MKSGMKTIDSYFKTSFKSSSEEVNFKGDFHAINSDADIDLDLIIIFDGGDVYGYEKDLKDSI